MKEAKGGTELTGERVRRAINAGGIGVFMASVRDFHLPTHPAGGHRGRWTCAARGRELPLLRRTYAPHGGFEFVPDFVGGRPVDDGAGARNYRYMTTTMACGCARLYWRALNSGPLVSETNFCTHFSFIRFGFR